MEKIQQQLIDSLEDFALSRSERKELKTLISQLQGNHIELAKVRTMAFRLATKSLEEFGELTVMDWLEAVIKQLYSNEMKIKASAYFSPGDDCLHRIREFISGARSQLDICVFTITDNRIVEKIIEAKQRGVSVRILSDDDKSEDLGSDLDYLIEKGVSCRFDRSEAHMHHKFAIADSSQLLNGSYNWTRSAATANNENILVTNDTKLVSQFQLEFDRLWQELK